MIRIEGGFARTSTLIKKYLSSSDCSSYLMFIADHCTMHGDKKATTEKYKYFTQGYIKRLTGISLRSQRRYMLQLQEWKFLSVHRGARNEVKFYEIHEQNIMSFFNDPEAYKEAKEQNALCIVNYVNPIKHLTTPSKKTEPDKMTGLNTNRDLHADSLSLKEKKNLKEEDNQRLSTTPSPKTALQRRKKQKEVNNRTLPVVQRKDEEISPKRKSINDFAYSRNFVRVKKLWNSLPTRKLSDYNPEKQNKTLDRSILAVQALLNGRLLETGITTAENKKVHVKLPDNFNVDDCGKLDIHWLLEKIERFGKIIEDEQLAPRNKDFLRRLSLGDFILGAMTNQGQSESVMFQYCCGEVQTVWEDPHPDITSAICHHFNTWTEKEHDYSGRELRELSKLSEKLVEFAEQKDVKRSRHLGKGNVARLANVFMKTLSIAWGAHFMVINPTTLAKENAWKTFVNNVEY